MELIASFDTEHQGLIHDSQFDFYGKRLFTACSDGKVNVFDVSNETQSKVAEIQAHEGPVFQAVSSHPRFGNLLATCGFDKKVIIWKESSKWEKVYEYTEHTNSINCLLFAPNEAGLILAVGSSDGTISVHEYKNDQWNVNKFPAHGFGVNAISWKKFSETEDELSLVSCGMDGLIKIWACKGNDINTFSCLVTLDGHEDIVRDVSWRTSRNCIVSGGDDHLVNLWIGENEAWEKTELGRFDAPVMRVTWDEKGGFLVLATSDGLVYLFKESGEGLLELISQTNNEGVVQNLEDQKK